MKKLTALALSAGLVLSMAACGNSADSGGNQSAGGDNNETSENSSNEETTKLVLYMACLLYTSPFFPIQ